METNFDEYRNNLKNEDKEAKFIYLQKSLKLIQKNLKEMDEFKKLNTLEFNIHPDKEDENKMVIHSIEFVVKKKSYIIFDVEELMSATFYKDQILMKNILKKSKPFISRLEIMSSAGANYFL